MFLDRKGDIVEENYNMNGNYNVNQNYSPGKKTNYSKIFVIALIVILIGVIGFLIYTKSSEKNKYVKTINKLEDQVRVLEKENKKLKQESDPNEITASKLVGTYNWAKKVDNFDLKITLVLNSDGSATYKKSSGSETEMTKGNFIYENDKVTYTKEYYNDDKNKGKDYIGDKKTEVFNVIDKDTLQNIYYNQTTELKKEQKEKTQ